MGLNNFRAKHVRMQNIFVGIKVLESNAVGLSPVKLNSVPECGQDATGV
jgi:hypothetical protein